MMEVIIKWCLVSDQNLTSLYTLGITPNGYSQEIQAEFRPKGIRRVDGNVGEVMDPSTETTLLLALGLACVAALVLLLNKESGEKTVA